MILACPFCGDSPESREGHHIVHWNGGCPISGRYFTEEEWCMREGDSVSLMVPEEEMRNNIIEECAKVCEWRDTDLDPEDTEYNPDAWGWTSKDYARNIRYLKSKP